jgi:uncharacterized protein (UPF0128 family)
MNANQNEQNGKEKFILAFDLPRELHSERKRVNLELRRMNAKMIQFSIWESEKLEELMKIALMIKNLGGSSKILEEKFLF